MRTDLLQNVRLTGGARQVLETFAFSLTMLLGDDAKVARETQMMHTLQHTVLGSSSDTDIVTCSLVLNHLVCTV